MKEDYSFSYEIGLQRQSRVIIHWSGWFLFNSWKTHKAYSPLLRSLGFLGTEHHVNELHEKCSPFQISSHAEVVSVLTDNRIFPKFLLHFPSARVFAVLQSTLEPLLFTEASPVKHLLCSLKHLSDSTESRQGEKHPRTDSLDTQEPYCSLDPEQVGDFQKKFYLRNKNSI